MSESSRSDSAPAHGASASAADNDRDAKIEQLLLTGLDHYFATQYQEAINVWTRALFLDRSHPRARAYIERARSAMAERQRQSEEMLHNGVDAFHRGDGDEARRLLQAAIDGGAPSDEAFAVLDRLNRFEGAGAPGSNQASGAARPDRVRLSRVAVEPAGREEIARTVALGLLVCAIVAGGIYAVMSINAVNWQAWVPLPTTTVPAPPAREVSLELPRRGEVAMTRARRLAAGGHLREALATLDGVRLTDPQRADADRLRADIQRQMLSLAPPAGERTDRTDSGRR